MLIKALVLAAQLQIPAPTGYVNDFANVIDSGLENAMTSLITEVRQKSGGEIAVVTLGDLEGRPSIEVARDIGRQWRVGAQTRAGDASSNAGVVLLLVPGVRPGDGRADLAIATGRGAEGFITDAETLRIRQAIGQASVERGSYAQGLAVGVQLLAQEYATEFGFELTGAVARTTAPRDDGSGGFWWLPILILFFLIGSGRGGFGRLFLLSMLLGGGRGRYHGGGWGGGGFGGGGFGGFGGGGGFSGGGSSGSF